MQTMYIIMLIMHIAGGYAALSSGLVTMTGRKGGKIHIITGRVFFFSMMAVSFSAMYMSIYKSTWFLLHVGIFVLYQVVAGWRSVKYKDLNPGFFDYLLLVATVINAACMIYSGNIILIVFAGISILLVVTDVQLYVKLFRGIHLPKLAWMRRHIGMMVGGYIGTITAFIVVNISIPGLAVFLWLSPTAILVPLMQYWTWKYTILPFKTKNSIPS